MDEMGILKSVLRLTLIAAFGLFFVSNLDAQQTKELKNVKGSWLISNDITPIQARENAIREAKIEALRQAGIPELISESNILYRSEKGLKMNELFQSVTTIDVAGEISRLDVTNEEKRVNEFGDLIYEVWIDATVLIHENKVDPGFDLEVIGIRESYSSPDKLSFQIKPSKEGYLTAFVISEEESGVLYPNSIEMQERLEAQKLYKFPKSVALDYEVTASNSVEINYLILLYTKSEIPFMLEQTPGNILKFIAAIRPSEKCLKSYSLLIKH